MEKKWVCFLEEYFWKMALHNLLLLGIFPGKRYDLGE